MRRTLTVLFVLVGLLVFATAARAQGTPVPPTLTPIVVTATPLSQVVVVTATPSAPPQAKTFWSEYGDDIIKGLLVLLIGGLLGALLKPTFEKLGSTIADALSRVFSGWGFRKRYLRHIIEEYRCLPIRGLRTRVPVAVELERVYVSLRAELPGALLQPGPSRGYSIGQVMGQHRRLAVVGGPGTGKTTLMSYLALTYARGRSAARLGLQKARLPILVPLRALKKAIVPAEGNGATSPATLPAYLSALYEGRDLKPPPDFFEKQLRAGRCLVLLDGLDEVADETERRRVSEWVDELVTVYPDNRYIVTSRPAGYRTAPLENDFTVYHIRDFEMDDVRQFVESWYLAVELATQGETDKARRDAAEQARGLTTTVRQNAGIRRLVVNPLLLSIVALVHRYRARLPDRRVDLYSECVDVLLEHWERAKGLGRLSAAEMRVVLQPLALAMHKDRGRVLSRPAVERLIGQYLPGVMGGQVGPQDVADFLDQVRERSGLLVEHEQGEYAFSHLTFQEYLAACEIVATEDEAEREFLVDNATDEWWREVLLLYAGMRDATAAVRALLARDVESRDGRPYLFLAGECVAEALKVSPEVREAVEQALEDVFNKAEESELFLGVGRVLARLKGDDAADFFLRLLDEGEERVRVAAAWSVGQIARQSDAAQLERIVRRLQKRLEYGQCMALAAIGFPALAEALAPDVLYELLADLAERSRALLRLIEESSDPAFQQALAGALDVTLLPVPAGEFQMGSDDKDSHGDEKPVHAVHLGTFYVARYPLTNAQWARFVQATGRKPPKHWKHGVYPAGKATHPVVYVSWRDARAYAEWAGLRLLSEAQWEKAVAWDAGQSRKRKWPWGDVFDSKKCNTYESGTGSTTPVGKYSPDGDSFYGVADMAGNVWEWTSSLYRDYPYRADDGREDLDASGPRVLRGGSFSNFARDARCACRTHIDPGNFYGDLGVRVGWWAAPASPLDSVL